MSRLNMLRTLSCLISGLLAAVPAKADNVVFVNLSSETVYLAKETFFDRAGVPPGTSGLAVEETPGWREEGWWRIGPGESYEGTAGKYYVERSGRPLSWSGLDREWGLISDNGNAFDIFLPRGSELQQRDQLLNSGYRLVYYLNFTPGLYTISGSAYLLRQMEFRIDERSRSPRPFNIECSVPGRVTHFNANLDPRGARYEFSQYRDRVHVFGSVAGSQVRPGGPREPGYLRGSITVFYTVRAN